MKRLLTLVCLTVLALAQATAQPKVVTDTRFARGATMAFGRISSVSVNGGSSITKRGFCLAETPEPTINDILHTTTLSNNGTIYCFKNLKPATKYYMRAYATNADGQTAYGDVIKFYTIPMGAITCSYNNGGDADANNRINAAITQACEIFSNLTSIKKNFNMGYSAGTQTADCSYTDEPWINMGPNSSYQRTGTVMHEMQHGLGLVPYSTQWNKNILRERLDGDGRGSGNWLGDRVSAFLDFWDNTTGSKLDGDYQHMWPYGVNGAHEDNGSDVLYYANALIGQALGEDGLEHRYSTFADPCYVLYQEDDVKYYIKSESVDHGRYTSYLIPNADGTLQWREITTEQAAQNDSTAWYITFTPENQYYQFRNVATGQYISYSKGLKTVARTQLTANDNWHLMKGRVDVDGQRGYWIIRSTATNWSPNCIVANANSKTGLKTFDISNAAVNQRWLIMSLAEMQAYEAKAIASMKASANDVLAQIKTLQLVPHQEDVSGIDQTTTDAIQNLETRISASSSMAEMTGIIAEAQEAANLFLQGVTPTDVNRPFDLTYMLVNPDLKSGSDGWSTDITINYDCGEFYEKTFDFNQTVSNLPAGNYRFSAQGFQRPGTTSASASVSVNAKIYAGSKSALIAHIKDGGQTKKIGTGKEVQQGSLYVPNDMQAANAYFQKGLYDNHVFGAVSTNGGSLKVGVSSTSMGTSYWAIFANFRLYFFGRMNEETALGINELSTKVPSQHKAIFTLDGRQLSPNTQLRPGLYIIDGRKTIVR
jgi:hypothetical protein